MKQKIKEGMNRINGIYGIILIIYTLVIINLQGLTDSSYLSGFTNSILSILVVWAAFKIIPKLKNISLQRRTEDLPKKMKTKWFLGIFFVSLLYLGIWLWAYYPGGFSPDSISQYKQVITHTYNDWHPVLQTLIAFWLPMQISGDATLIVLFQIIEFSLVLAYAGITLLTFGDSVFWIIVGIGYILLNPLTGSIIMYPWKDCTFAILALLCMCYVIHIYCTSGKWLSRWSNSFLFAFALAVATVCRHNSVLFTFPLLLSVLILDGKNRDKIRSAIFFIIIMILIKGPLYSALNVESPSNRQSEMMGLPMTIIGNVVKETPDRLDDETKEFVYSIASQEEWEEYYSAGSWNNLKFTGVDTTSIDQEPPLKILKITVKCIITSPKAALKALLKLTGMVWSIGGDAEWVISPGITTNDYGITYSGNSILKILIVLYSYIGRFTFLKYFCYFIGVIQLALLILMFGKYTIKDYKRLSICVPLFVYNFGTMLLLSGFDFRFFYYSFTIFPLLVFILLTDYDKSKCGSVA